jgi:hypothetical protein
MEGVLAPEALDRIFEANAQVEYIRELLFSDLVNLMSLVVCGIYPSVNAAYRARAQQLNVSRTAVYDKLNGVEPRVCAALVKETAAAMASLIEFIGGSSPKLLAALHNSSMLSIAGPPGTKIFHLLIGTVLCFK